jgi:hypothetical protein
LHLSDFQIAICPFRICEGLTSCTVNDSDGILRAIAGPIVPILLYAFSKMFDVAREEKSHGCSHSL